jgi:hypothetical protein
MDKAFREGLLNFRAYEETDAIRLHGGPPVALPTDAFWREEQETMFRECLLGSFADDVWDNLSEEERREREWDGDEE